jgi:TolB-like protein
LKRLSACALAAAALLSFPCVAAARERVAVLILPASASEAALADSLTEVAISRVAEISDLELVGTREVRRRFTLSGGGELTAECLGQQSCLGRIGVMIGVRRLVSGTVRADGSRCLIAMAINDIQTGTVERNFFRTVEGGAELLARAVREGMNDLFQRRPGQGQLRVESTPDGATVVVDDRQRGMTPIWISPIEAGHHRLRVEMSGRFPWNHEVDVAPGADLSISIKRDQLAPRRTWAPFVGYGSAAASAVAFGLAAVFGTLGEADPSGRTRGAAQKDLATRQGYAATANVLLLAGSALALASGFTLIRFRRDVFGE